MIGNDSTANEIRQDEWDAIVLGAGPAGAMAARQIARRGRRVLLVDKGGVPRDKVCGGCLGGGALHVLASVGLAHLPRACGGVPLETFTLASGRAIAHIPIGHRVAVSRRTFDAALIHEAVQAGVVFRDQTRGALLPLIDDGSRQVSLRCRAGAITTTARVVILATGRAPCPPPYTTRIPKGSRVGLGAVLERSPGEIKPGELYMACGSAGYVGITAVEGRRFDVAAAVDPHALAAAESPGELIHNLLKGCDFAPVIDLRSVAWRGTPLLTRRTTPLASHRCLVIGDAAGYEEPFTGEGIGWALYSAVSAASLLEGSLGRWNPSTAAHWQRHYDSVLAERHRWCRIMSQVLRVKPLRELAVWGLSKAPCFSLPVVRRLDRTFAMQFP